jgi:protein arginine kinase activator
MMCQRCQKEASVYLTEPIEGQRRELHLCQACARKAGLSLPESPPNLALDAVVQSLIVANVGELVGELAELSCPDCGIKFMEFRAVGRLGCPHDYRVFAAGLVPLMQRFHAASRHVGKVARRHGGSAHRLRLRTQLREAVSREDYEEAARLRDLLRLKDFRHDSR